MNVTRHTLIPVLLCSALWLLLAPLSSFPASEATGRLLARVGPDFSVDSSFRSHLPLLVFETDDSATHLEVYASFTGSNFLQHVPQASLSVAMLEEPGQKGSGKRSYSLTLIDSPLADAAQARGISLAGLPEDRRWRLQGSLRDRGMLRNGLAYEIGRILFPVDTPATQYCEVLFKRNGRYEYQGIYILAQSLEGLFTRRSAGSVGTAGGILLHYSPDRDRMRQGPGEAGDEAVYGWSLQDRGFRTVYPLTGVPISQEGRMEMAIDRLEKTLESLRPGTYLTYMSQLDQQSAQDIFLLNSLLLNTSRSVPFFLARKPDDQLLMLPDWDFDTAIDNAPVRRRPLPFEQEPPDVVPPSPLAKRIPVWRQLEDGRGIRGLRLYPVYESLDGGSFLWFDRLFLSKPFLTGLAARYAELRRNSLAPEKVSAMVDSLATRLGPALERDWYRWQREYTASQGQCALLPFTDAEGETHIRQTTSYGQELIKIRYSLREQDRFLAAQMGQMGWLSADLFDRAMDGNRQAGYALAVMLAFLFLTYMLTRKL